MHKASSAKASRQHAQQGIGLLSVVISMALFAVLIALVSEIQLSARIVTETTEHIGAIRDVGQYLRQKIDCAATVQAPACASQPYAVVEAKRCGGGILLTSSPPYTQIAKKLVRTTCGTSIGTQQLLVEYEARLANGSTEWRPMNRGIPMMCSAPPVSTEILVTGAAYGSTCGISAGTVYCWGGNYIGVLGTTHVNIIPNGQGPTNDRVTGCPLPLEVPLPAPAIKVSMGGSRACAILDNGEMWCWGNNYRNALGNLSQGIPTQFGYYSSSPVKVEGLGGAATEMAVGDIHTCAVVNGAAKCWGGSDYGQLGNGSLYSASTPQQVTGLTSGVTKIAASVTHTCAVVNGGVRCWGSNSYYELGTGTASEMSTTPVAPVGLELNAQVTDIAIGYGYSCAIVHGGVKCWGRNGIGQAGQPSTVTDQPTPAWVSSLEAASGVTAIGANQSTFTCALVQSGIKCWGRNANGVIGNLSYGSNFYSPMPIPNLMTDTTSLTVGAGHACAVKLGKSYCWGYNGMGELGNGVTGYNASRSAFNPQPVSSSCGSQTPVASSCE